MGKPVRFNIVHSKLIELKNKSGLSYKDLDKIIGAKFQNYVKKDTKASSMRGDMCMKLATVFNCDIEEFTNGKTFDKRALGNNIKSRMVKSNPDYQRTQSWSEVLPNGVIFIHAPFMETWQSSMTNHDLPNCIYHRDHLGMKRKIIEKQKNATVMYLDDWRPIDDIREAFDQIRELRL